MGTTQLRVVGVGLLCLIIFLSGRWLSQAGKPYSVLVLAVHKLISVAAVALLFTIVYQMNQAARLSPVQLTAGVVTGLFFLATIAAGGALSTEKPMPAWVLTVHQIMPFLAVFSTGATLYLLLSRSLAR